MKKCFLSTHHPSSWVLVDSAWLALGQEYNEKVFFGPHTIHPSGCWLTLPGLAMGHEYNGKVFFWVCMTSIHPGRCWFTLVPSSMLPFNQWPDRREQLATKQLNLSIRIPLCKCHMHLQIFEQTKILFWHLFDTLIGIPNRQWQLWPCGLCLTNSSSMTQIHISLGRRSSPGLL
jgi:hypothetical protein